MLGEANRVMIDLCFHFWWDNFCGKITKKSLIFRQKEIHEDAKINATCGGSPESEISSMSCTKLVKCSHYLKNPRTLLPRPCPTSCFVLEMYRCLYISNLPKNPLLSNNIKLRLYWAFEKTIKSIGQGLEP